MIQSLPRLSCGQSYERGQVHRDAVSLVELRNGGGRVGEWW